MLIEYSIKWTTGKPRHLMPTSDEWSHPCTPTGKNVKQSKTLASKPEHTGCSTKTGPEPLPKSDVSMPRDVIINKRGQSYMYTSTFVIS